jgi:glutamyl-tRNA reductase
MAAVAAQTVGAAERVAVLGSGIMAMAVVDGLLQLPAPPKITVLARNPDKVADRPELEVLSLQRAPEVIAGFPAVVSATSAKHRLIDDATIAAAFEARTDPLLLIDMAMPPDFDAPAGDGITYIDIDYLARLADRRSRSDEADALVESAAAEAYRQYRDHHEVGPVIGSLMANADEIVEAAVRRFSGRLRDIGDAEVVRQTAHTVARTLLAGPVSYLKGESRAPEAIDILAEAFGVEDE